MEKLEIMIKLAADKNIDQVLLEFKEYATEVDVDFVRKVRTRRYSPKAQRWRVFPKPEEVPAADAPHAAAARGRWRCPHPR